MSKRRKNFEDDAAEAEQITADAQAQASYGYAHRAHNPDPNANYSFDRNATRVLPTAKRLRWKVTG